jgi:hypothetical protein
MRRKNGGGVANVGACVMWAMMWMHGTAFAGIGVSSKKTLWFRHKSVVRI